MSSSDSPPQLDFAALPLPTDRIELGQLRRKQPAIFNPYSEWHTPVGVGLLAVTTTINLEHILARRAFASACGLPDPHPEEDRNELIRLLNDEYKRYGISSGLEHTRQLARDIETAAIRQLQGRNL